MSFVSMKQFMEDNHFTSDMLTENEKVYVDIFDALTETKSHEEYIQAKEKYKDKFPIFTKVCNEVNGFFNEPETSAFVKALSKYTPSVTNNLSQYDGEVYYDGLHDSIKHKYTNDVEWKKTKREMTTDGMKALPYTPNVDLQQLKGLDRFFDEAYQLTEAMFRKADEKYHNGKALNNTDASSIYNVLYCAMEKGDKALYKETYDAVMSLEAKFHEIKDWDKLQFPILNYTPTRNPHCPIEFKDNYFLSSIIMQAPLYNEFKIATGLSLSDAAKNPNYYSAEIAKTLISRNIEKAIKENIGTPAHDKEAFNFLTSKSIEANQTLSTLGVNGPMVASTFGLSMIIHLDKNMDSPEAMQKEDASDCTVIMAVDSIVNDMKNIPVYKRLEALAKVANPMENWQAAFGLTKAPIAKGEQIGKGAQTLVNLVQESQAPLNEKQGMMMGIERGLHAAYKENTWFLQRWIGWGDAKQYKATISNVKEKRIALSAPPIEENKPKKPTAEKEKVDLGIKSNKKQLSPDPVRKDAPTVTKNIDVNAPK